MKPNVCKGLTLLTDKCPQWIRLSPLRSNPALLPTAPSPFHTLDSNYEKLSTPHGSATQYSLSSPITSVNSLIPVRSVSRKAIRQPTQGLARLRKTTQGPRKNSSANLSCKPSPLFPISFSSALSYSAVKHPLRVWALISNPVKKSPRLNKEIRSLGIQGLKKLRKLIQLM